MRFDVFMKKLLSKSLFKTIGEIAETQGVDAYVIGGFVRDWYLNRESTDIDIVVIGSGIDVANELGRRLDSRVSVFKNFGTAMLKSDNLEVEFVGARKESYREDSRKPIVEDGTLQDDQLRRDFTINALAWSLNKGDYGTLLDPFEGMKDLEECLIRTPTDPDITFSDDPLRMMRAIRFASQLGFDIVDETFEAIEKNKERINIVSKERIVDELNKIILSPMPSMGFNLLSNSGLLAIIMPELERMKGVERRGRHAHKDNFEHTLQVLDNIARKTDDLWLRWAALLHDVAKPQTKGYDPQIGWTFHGHEVVGSNMIPRIFRRMRMPLNEKMKFVRKMVFLHMRPKVLVEEDVTDSAVRRLLFEAGDDIEALMTLCEADITSENPAKVREYKNNFRMVREKMKEIEEKDRIRNFQPPISGYTIMETYGLEPRREVGEIKEEIKNAILDGEIDNDYDQAFELMEKLAKGRGFKRVATPKIPEE